MSRVVLFDFDGVLVRGDCTARLIRHLLMRSMLHRTLAYAVTPLALPLMLARPTMRYGARIYFRLAFSRDADGAAVASALAHVVDAHSAHWVERAWARLAEHRAAGDRVVVVTGAAQMLVRALLAARGVADVELVATAVEQSGGRWVAGRHCYGAEKVRMLTERGLAPPWDVAYSDSDADLPMLTRAARPVLVTPSARARARVVHALPGIEHVDW